jgi:hypothetical protein
VLPPREEDNLPTETALPELDEQTSTISDPAAEARLANEIVALWQARVSAHGSIRKSQEELRAIRASLAEKLHGFKLVLSRRGCQGGWSSFLNAQGFSRATADRLATAHEKSLAQAPGNCLAEQILEPDEDIRRYVRALWPKLSRLLNNRMAVEVFATELNRVAEKSFADKRSVSSPAESFKIPSYLRHLDLPVIHRSLLAT